jgi:hypothetical protein
LGVDSYTPLKATDWTGYRWLNLAAYNPGEKDQRLNLRISDSAGGVTETSAVVPAGGPCTLEFDLKMLQEARLNTREIKFLTLYLNTADEEKDPVLIVDNLGIHTGTFEERKKAEIEEDQAEDEEEDWDSEEQEEGKLELGVISRPSGITGQAAAPAPASPTAK